MIHGHTHRQDIHQYDNFKRYVLGDWSDNKGNALKIDAENIEFIEITKKFLSN